MRLSDFWTRMERRFGAVYAESLARDHVFAQLDGRTVNDALEAGAAAKDVWRAVCDTFEVPANQR